MTIHDDSPIRTVGDEPHWSDLPPSPSPSREPAAPRGRRSTAPLLMLASALLGGITGGVVGALVSEGGVTSTGSPVVTAPPVDTAFVGQTDVAKAANVIAPSVVTIAASNPSGGAVGTGIIISSDGQILTNEHVVDDATGVRVRLPGQTAARDARVVATDAANDLALLQLDGVSGLTAAVLADPAGIAVGDPVVAVGYALDLDGGPSVTSGIVSALNRTLSDANGALDGLIQTDAAISSGNSGGPLINLRGEVVGINTAVIRGDSGTAANNVGFAIGVGEVRRVLELLQSGIDDSNRREGYLGVTVTGRTDGGQGAVVASVAEGSPAATAGLQEGDIVLEVDGQTVTGQGALVAVIRDSQPGDSVTLSVERAGQTIELTAVLGVREG